MPPHLSGALALQPRSMNVSSVGRDHFGHAISTRLPLESSRSPPAGQLDKTAILLGRLASLAMGWVQKWFRLCRNFSGALMKAVRVGIAKGACRLAAAAPLGKVRRPLGEREELERNGSKIHGREKPNHDKDCQEHLLLESWSQEAVERLIEDGQHPESFFSAAKMDKMDLGNGTALCLISHSLSIEFGDYSESSSDEEMGLETADCPGGLPRNALSVKGYFDDSCSLDEEFGDFEKDPEGVSKERRESVERSRDFVMFEEQSLESSSDSSEDGEHLLQYEKAKENTGTPPISCGFTSSLVLSLFYSPSEEDDDDDEEEEDDSEDWSSEDEVEETGQSCLPGTVSENRDRSSAAEGNSQHQDFPENFHRSFSTNMDSLHSRCASKSTQPASVTPPQPRKHTEITASLRKPDSKPEAFCNPPKRPSPKDQRSATGHPPRQCCRPEIGRNHDFATAETSLGSRKESQKAKKVRFSPEVTVHTLVVWDYASRAARRGPWEEMARDRCRFQRRIGEVGAIVGPCLEAEHRAEAWRKIHGALDLVRPENPDAALQSTAGWKQLSV
ncbi:protein phosphatase 1 regulatory subunit 15A [Paroedura picta]|uniref:protein phosphatase 1 regulatory subunit 15A n=1 Tax=Paroedura picta TaxID=143630 RepID=UPI00405780D4